MRITLAQIDKMTGQPIGNIVLALDSIMSIKDRVFGRISEKKASVITMKPVLGGSDGEESNMYQDEYTVEGSALEIDKEMTIIEKKYNINLV